nr:MAG TPA: hypothetical protein [Caudoviricetes sp.]
MELQRKIQSCKRKSCFQEIQDNSTLVHLQLDEIS